MSAKQALQPRGSRSSAVFRRASVAKDRDAHDKSAARAAGGGQLSRPANAEKLKKHITLVADRLNKGLRPGRDPVVMSSDSSLGGGGGGASSPARVAADAM